VNKSGKGCLIAVLVVFGLLALGAVLLVVGIAFLGHKAEDKLNEVGDALSTPSTIDPTNPGARSQDDVLGVGEPVRISGFTTTVRKARFVDTLEGYPPGHYLVLEVTIENRDDRPQTLMRSAWSVQQPASGVVPPIDVDPPLSGSVEANATVSGTVVFQLAGEPGDHFVLYRPDPLDEARGVWPVSP
jgi:hypothetical protein